MKFLVMEIQKIGDVVTNLVTSHDTLADAESKYYAVLSAAAISTVEVHSAILICEDGKPLKHESFRHYAETTEPVVEEVTEDE